MSAATGPDSLAYKDYKATLLPLLVTSKVLSFGSYILKSGRESPYFFTSTLLHTAPLLHATASSFADILSNPPFVATSAGGTIQPNFDVIFGPAYKGIPLCTAIVNELAVRDSFASPPHQTWNRISYSFNRKEAKAHGEGGSIVGAPLEGKRVLIVDDVITAGTALREAIAVIKREGGIVAGVVVILDREERVSDIESKSALGVAQRHLGEDVPVRAVITLTDLIEKLGSEITEYEIQKLKEYRQRYKAE